MKKVMVFKCKNENQGKPTAKEEEVSAGKQAIPGGDKVGEKDQNPNVDGASDSNYTQIGILAPCSSERCVLKGPPKGCGMAAYKKLAESHTQVLKKVSEVESNADQESNAQSSVLC